MLLDILFPLSITLLLEPLIFSLIKKFDFKVFLVSSIANLVLNTTMNVIIHFILEKRIYALFLFNYEIATIFVEALIVNLFCKIKYGKCLLFSMFANIASLTMGSMLNSFGISSIYVSIILFVFYAIFFVLVFLYNSPNKEHDSNN